MQVVNGRLVVLLAAAGRAGEHFLKTRLRLPLPAADLVRMYFVLARDRLDRAVPAQRFGRYLGFELRCESASFRRHPLGPPHGLVYTLTSCPFFRDHLKFRLSEFGSDEWFELAQKMFDFTGDNVFVIGTVGEAPNILLTNNDLRNVPTEFPVSNTDWKGNLMYWADQLWLDR